MTKIMVQLALLPYEYKLFKQYCKDRNSSVYWIVTDLVRDKVREIESSDSYKVEYEED